MTSSLPLVSVVIGVYNGAGQIERCLASLLDQNYPADRLDIIVVENGSTDNTADIVRQFPVRLFQNSVRGLAPARNLGLNQSRGDIVATTDADCIADPNWVSELVKAYSDPNVGGAGGLVLAYEHAQRNVVEVFSDKHAPLVNYISGSHEFLPHLVGANASYRRELLTAIGGFNPKMLTGEDVDVSWRIQLETHTRLVYVPTAIIRHHHRATRHNLGRLYRHYGFGEILLDTMYCHYPDYPRQRAYQIQRVLRQMAVLPRYLLSALWRRLRWLAGQADLFAVEEPLLWFLIESNNIIGKLEGFHTTRWMTTAEPVFQLEPGELIARLYGGKR